MKRRRRASNGKKRRVPAFSPGQGGRLAARPPAQGKGAPLDYGLSIPHHRVARPLALAVLLMALAGALFLWKWGGRPPEAGSAAGHADAGKRVASGDQRGTIYDRRLRPLAVSLPVGTVIARPRRLQLDERHLARLAVLLDADPDNLRQRLTSNRPVEVLVRGLAGERALEVERLGLEGIEVMHGTVRYYPEAERTAFCVGFTAKGRGVRGLEALADEQWGGRFPASGACIATVDVDLQRRALETLAALQRELAAQQGAVVILDAADGGVLALAGSPAFDPNRYWRYGSETLENPALDGPVGAEYFAPLFDGTATQAQGWQEAGEGVFRSFAAPTFQAPLPEWARNASVSLGRRGEAPGLLDLAVGIAGLVANGRRPQPHLVAGLWRQGHWRPWRAGTAAEVNAGAAGTGSDAISRLAPDGRFGFAEVLMAASRPPAGEEQGDGRNDTAGATALGDVVACGFVLGARPLVAAIRLTGGRVGLQGPSPLRRALKAMLAAAAIVGPVPAVRQEELTVDIAGLQQRWRREQEKEESKSEENGGGETSRLMPNVVGMSLRKALYTLREMDCRFTVRGSGRVVAQEPGPGEPLQDGGCFLQLEMDEQTSR